MTSLEGMETVTTLSQSCTVSDHPKRRSGVTNGTRLHVERPGDTKWARRFADVLCAIIADISGPEGLSEGQRQLARRAATISLACEKLEGEAAAGAHIDLELYGSLTDRLGRAFARLGLKKRRSEILSVTDYVATINAREAGR